MKKNLLKLSALLLFSTAFVFPAKAQNVSKHQDEGNAKKAAGAGLSFKIPPKVMPMKTWEGYKGLLMLSADGSPWGIYISYPNEGETADSLKTRLEKTLLRMFVHDEAKAAEAKWTSISTAVHKGDSSASAKTYDEESQSVQINFYERQYNGLNFIYGYFARKSKTDNKDSSNAKFLDETGKGSKVFDEFWKTFPKN